MLLEGELRGLIRFIIERAVPLLFRYDDPFFQIVFLIATRIVASMVAVLIFQYVRDIENINTYTAYTGIGMFAIQVGLLVILSFRSTKPK